MANRRSYRRATSAWLSFHAVATVIGLAAAIPSAQSRGPRALDAARPIGTFVATGRREGDGYRAADRQLAEWALAALAARDRRALDADRQRPEDRARVRLYWAGPQGGQYGEMRSLLVDGAIGAAGATSVPTRNHSVPTSTGSLTSDPLFRDTVVYLTCLHELGHAFGLEHTADYRDIMYSFQYGGDIVEYFARFRRQLTTRDDMARAYRHVRSATSRRFVVYPAR